MSDSMSVLRRPMMSARPPSTSAPVITPNIHTDCTKATLYFSLHIRFHCKQISLSTVILLPGKKKSKVENVMKKETLNDENHSFWKARLHRNESQCILPYSIADYDTHYDYCTNPKWDFKYHQSLRQRVSRSNKTDLRHSITYSLCYQVFQLPLPLVFSWFLPFHLILDMFTFHPLCWHQYSPNLPAISTCYTFSLLSVLFTILISMVLITWSASSHAILFPFLWVKQSYLVNLSLLQC